MEKIFYLGPVAHVSVQGQGHNWRSTISSRSRSQFKVKYLTPLLMEGFLSNLNDTFTSTRGCAEPMFFPQHILPLLPLYNAQWWGYESLTAIVLVYYVHNVAPLDAHDCDHWHVAGHQSMCHRSSSNCLACCFKKNFSLKHVQTYNITNCKCINCCLLISDCESSMKICRRKRVNRMSLLNNLYYKNDSVDTYYCSIPSIL